MNGGCGLLVDSSTPRAAEVESCRYLQRFAFKKDPKNGNIQVRLREELIDVLEIFVDDLGPVTNIVE